MRAFSSRASVVAGVQMLLAHAPNTKQHALQAGWLAGASWQCGWRWAAVLGWMSNAESQFIARSSLIALHPRLTARRSTSVTTRRTTPPSSTARRVSACSVVQQRVGHNLCLLFPCCLLLCVARCSSPEPTLHACFHPPQCPQLRPPLRQPSRPTMPPTLAAVVTARAAANPRWLSVTTSCPLTSPSPPAQPLLCQ